MFRSWLGLASETPIPASCEADSRGLDDSAADSRGAESLNALLLGLGVRIY